MKTWQGILLGILVGLLCAGLMLLFILPQRGEPIRLLTATPRLTPEATSTTVMIQVHVLGSVHNPGVYPLIPNARIQDAILAAGGCDTDADLERVNLSAFLQDGQRLYIPSQGESIPVDETSRGQTISLASGGLLNINSATLEELIALPGIGSTKAQAILLHRHDHGPFTQLEDLLNVDGIGPSTLELLRPLITLGP